MEPALSQLEKLTAAETHRLDRAIVAISVNPELGTPVPGTLLRDYVDDVDGVRVIYYVTALRQHDRGVRRSLKQQAAPRTATDPGRCCMC
ncbi:hypothetical protein SUDANB111_07705 (plasmid) [Streptomyces sp. enrichment culture]